MPDGGFLIKLNGKNYKRCTSVSFDYDEWTMKINNEKQKPIPANVKTISVVVEDEK